jgi:uncharacterized protein
MSAAENQTLIAEAFAAWEHGDYQPFFKVVADDVRWTVIGSTPISGMFEGKRAFLNGRASRRARTAAPTTRPTAG